MALMASDRDAPRFRKSLKAGDDDEDIEDWEWEECAPEDTDSACEYYDEEYDEEEVEKPKPKPKPAPKPVEPEEPEECFVEQVRNNGDKSPFDMSLDFMNDYTRTVKMTLGDDEKPFHLIPDTGLSSIILIKDKCFGCYSLGDSHRYTETCSDSVSNHTVSTDVDFFYQLHAYSTTLNSTQYEEKACMHFDDKFDRCTNLVVLGGQRSSPRALFLKGNGFLGLGVGETRVEDNKLRKLGALDQFFDKGIIDKKVFGIDTQLHNATTVATSIRFGDYKLDTVPETHELKWVDTKYSDSWNLPLMEVNF
jgi:hypothetical protein